MAQRPDRGKQLTPVVNRGDANTDQVIGRQIGNDLGVNVVLAERLLVLPQAKGDVTVTFGQRLLP